MNSRTLQGGAARQRARGRRRLAAAALASARAALRCSNSWPTRGTRCTRFARATQTPARVRSGGARVRARAKSSALLGAADARRRPRARCLADAALAFNDFHCRVSAAAPGRGRGTGTGVGVGVSAYRHHAPDPFPSSSRAAAGSAQARVGKPLTRICGAEQRRTLGLRAYSRASTSDSRGCLSGTSAASATSSARRPSVRAAQGSRAPRVRPPQPSGSGLPTRA